MEGKDLDRRLKIGLSLLAIGLVLFSISIIALVVAHPSALIATTLIVVSTTPGFILTILGMAMTISAIGPGKRGALSIGIGAAICAIVVPVILTQVAWLDIAVILSVISLLFVVPLFIIPGIIVLKYQKIGGATGYLCVLLAASMMWTLVASAWVYVNVSAPYDFRTALYDALLYLLVLGFFAGFWTTFFIWAYMDMYRPRHRPKQQ